MASIASSWVIAHPSHLEPNLILQINQASGAFQTLAEGAPRVQLDSEDKYVYIRRADVRTKVHSNAAAGNLLPSCEIVMSLISAPTYLQRVRAEYDHHDTAMMGKWGASLPEAQRLAMRQGHFQLLRDKLLFGVIPANGEGLVNSPGATTVNLPADSYGNTTVITYDNGQMAFFLLQQLLAIKQRTYQLGIPRRFVILGPQRTLGLFEYNVVQLTSFQRVGAGTASTAGVFKDVAELNGDTIEWVYDDTLQNYSSSGVDTVILTMPEVEQPKVAGINTNEFAMLTPNLAAINLMYTDVSAPVEIPTPLPGGAIDVLSEMRASPGWNVRPEGLTQILMTY